MQSRNGYVHLGSNVHKELQKVFLLRSTKCLLSSGMSVGVGLLFIRIICTFLQLMTPAFGEYLLFILSKRSISRNCSIDSNLYINDILKMAAVMFLIEYKEIFLGPDIIILCAFNRPKCYSISINVPLIKCHSINYVSTKFTRLQLKSLCNLMLTRNLFS